MAARFRGNASALSLSPHVLRSYAGHALCFVAHPIELMMPAEVCVPVVDHR